MLQGRERVFGLETIQTKFRRGLMREGLGLQRFGLANIPNEAQN